MYVVCKDDNKWDNRAVPYSDEMATEKNPNAIYPAEEIKNNLAENNGSLENKQFENTQSKNTEVKKEEDKQKEIFKISKLKNGWKIEIIVDKKHINLISDLLYGLTIGAFKSEVENRLKTQDVIDWEQIEKQETNNKDEDMVKFEVKKEGEDLKILLIVEKDFDIKDVNYSSLTEGASCFNDTNLPATGRQRLVSPQALSSDSSCPTFNIFNAAFMSLSVTRPQTGQQ